MSNYVSHKQKTQRAFRAYLDLLDTAEWIKGELRGPLASFDLTMGEFRLLELLYDEGALFVSDIARRRRLYRQAVDVLIARLVERGWVRRAIVTLPPAERKRAHVAKSTSDEGRRGRRINAIGLTKLGKKFIGNVLPSHSKVVKSLMRALEGREQETLSRLCRKLREGDVMKFVSELTHEDAED